MEYRQNITDFLDKVERAGLNYAIITGKHENLKEVHLINPKNFVQDLDIVFFGINWRDLHNKLLSIGLKHIASNTYHYSPFPLTDDIYLPIDIYIDYINVDYYKIFSVDKNSIQIINGYRCISEEDYFIYQFTEPLIKFSEYKKRHRIRLLRYLEEGALDSKTKKKLYSIIGTYATNHIITSLLNDAEIDKRVIKVIKLHLLFQHGNLLRILKKRIFHYET